MLKLGEDAFESGALTHVEVLTKTTVSKGTFFLLRFRLRGGESAWQCSSMEYCVQALRASDSDDRKTAIATVTNLCLAATAGFSFVGDGYAPLES